MTSEETRTILTIMKTTYPNFYKSMTAIEMRGMLDVWCELFQDDDVELVKVALKQLILTSKYPPAISEIKEAMYSIMSPIKMNTLEAFGLLKRACRRDSTSAKEEYDKLPNEVQRAIRSYTALQEWAVMDEREFETIVYARFRDMYNQELAEMKKEFISTSQMLETKEQFKIEQGETR